MDPNSELLDQIRLIVVRMKETDFGTDVIHAWHVWQDIIEELEKLTKEVKKREIPTIATGLAQCSVCGSSPGQLHLRSCDRNDTITYSECEDCGTEIPAGDLYCGPCADADD